MKYLIADPFIERGITVAAFRTPHEGVWASAREVSGLHALLGLGPDELADELRRVAADYG